MGSEVAARTAKTMSAVTPSSSIAVLEDVQVQARGKTRGCSLTRRRLQSLKGIKRKDSGESQIPSLTLKIIWEEEMSTALVTVTVVGKGKETRCDTILVDVQEVIATEMDRSSILV